MPTLRCAVGLLVTSCPLIWIVPVVGSSNPAIMRSVVVFPQPDGPRKETSSPFSISRLKSSTATELANIFETFVRVKKFMVSLSLARSLDRWQAFGSATPGELDHPG